MSAVLFMIGFVAGAFMGAYVMYSRGYKDAQYDMKLKYGEPRPLYSPEYKKKQENELFATTHVRKRTDRYYEESESRM